MVNDHTDSHLCSGKPLTWDVIVVSNLTDSYVRSICHPGQLALQLDRNTSKYAKVPSDGIFSRWHSRLTVQHHSFCAHLTAVRLKLPGTPGNILSCSRGFMFCCAISDRFFLAHMRISAIFLLPVEVLVTDSESQSPIHL